ncbi:MAG: dTDP-4-dehydrorhamnose reductase [Elainellaceae cyanobacterium]
MAHILLVGAQGQVGQELQDTLTAIGNVVSMNRSQLDLTHTDSIRAVIRDVVPDIIVNAAAYTAVDAAETDVDLAKAVNAIAPTIMAEEAQKAKALLVHFSTDYVFDGQKNTPYTEDDPPNPLGVYGETKLLGEDGIRRMCDRHLILRTAWVYGAKGKGNFVKTMLRLGAEREDLRVVFDQVGTPTWARDIANTAAWLIPLERRGDARPGVYHVTNSGVTSWYDFAVSIFEEARQLGMPLTVNHVTPITTADYPMPAQRPMYSILSNQKISTVLGTTLPHWRHSLRDMLRELVRVTS